MATPSPLRLEGGAEGAERWTTGAERGAAGAEGGTIGAEGPAGKLAAAPAAAAGAAGTVTGAATPPLASCDARANFFSGARDGAVVAVAAAAAAAAAAGGGGWVDEGVDVPPASLAARASMAAAFGGGGCDLKRDGVGGGVPRVRVSAVGSPRPVAGCAWTCGIEGRSQLFKKTSYSL